MPKLLNQQEYANHRKERGLPGQTRQAVNKKIKTGAIPVEMVDGKALIDPVKADAAWDAASKRAPSSGPGAEEAKLPVDGAAPQSRESLTLTRARAAREGINAKRAQVELEKLQGKLLPTDKVVDSTFTLVRIFRDRARGMAPKLAPRLAVATTAPECQEIVAKEVDELLADLNRGFSGIADAARNS